MMTDINIEIKKGELVFIMGPSGSGKSSFVQSLFGEMHQTLHQASDLSDSQTTPMIEITESISYLSQEPFILPASIKENIIMDLPEEEKRLQWALRHSALEQDLQNMGCGTDMKVGTRGSSQSGGQIIRQAFARNLYKNSDLYILDDLFKSLDVKTSNFIMENTIQKQLKNKARIVITNSLEFAKYADRVIVFDNGKIIHDGTFKSAKPLHIFEDLFNIVDETLPRECMEQCDILSRSKFSLSKSKFSVYDYKTSVNFSMKKESMTSKINFSVSKIENESAISDIISSGPMPTIIKKTIRPIKKKIVDNHFLDEDRVVGTISFKHVNHIAFYIGGWTIMLLVGVNAAF